MNAKPTKPTSSASEPRTFNFDDADFSVAIPENLPATPRGNELPFKKWFTKHAAAALDGKQPHLFVPHAFWTGEKGVASDVKGGLASYSRTKLRDQFGAWKKKADTKGVEALALVVVPRTGTEDPKIAGIAEPGISIWMRKN